MNGPIEWETTSVVATRDGMVVGRAQRLGDGQWWAYTLDGLYSTALGEYASKGDAVLAISEHLAARDTERMLGELV